MGRREVVDRFEEKIIEDDVTGCWLWAAAIGTDGYGKFRLTCPSRMIQAHRVSYLLAGNSIPRGYQLDHLCMNKACVNPEHLEPVTPAENTYRARRFNGPGWLQRRED